MVRSFIQTTAILLTLGASFFLLKANLGLTPETIARLSSTYFGYNIEIAKSFAQQSSDTRIGIILLLISFALQMWNMLWPMRIDDFAVNWRGVLISFIFCIMLLIIAHWYSIRLSEKSFTKSMQIIEEKRGEKNKAKSLN